MNEIIGVHGIGQQQSGRNQLLSRWRPALADGVEQAVGDIGPYVDLGLSYYGDTFSASDGGVKGAVKDVGGDDIADLDDDALEFLADLEREVVDEEPPDEARKSGFKRLPQPVARLATWLDHRFGVAARILFITDLVQVRNYQRNDELADIVRQRLHDSVDAGTRVIIGHSLGSVVAYEYLCLTDTDVSSLITIGSPLALRSIQKVLRTRVAAQPSAPRVERWVNIFDPGDSVSLAGGLSPTWPAALDQTVDNGRDPHAATRYLGKQQTGRAVADALGPCRVQV